MKKQIQQTLRRVGLYHRLRASRIYDLYWSISDGAPLEDRRKEVSFYRELLQGFRAGELIFDVGANQGSKTAIFLALGARVIAVEPDAENQTILREMFLKYRLQTKPVKIVGKALSDQCAVETMWIDEPGSAKNTLSQKWVDTLRTDQARFGHNLQFAEKREIETTTMEQLFVEHGVPFFVKIDVEGYEPNVLRGMQRPVPYLSFEVNLPEFQAEGVHCIERLGQIAGHGKFNYAVDCRLGLVLSQWVDQTEFLRIFDRCTEPSIEVFWSTVPAVP
ncbi:MAG: FkbM family methyltransferase [Acidobacteria bacterium]|nr:FkbM family methyltransferase [Acidobacteriota bacterium]